MKRFRTIGVIVSVLAMLTINAEGTAAEMKKVVILNFPSDAQRLTMLQLARTALKQAGFEDQKNILITELHSNTVEEDIAQIKQLQPDVVLDLSLRPDQVIAQLQGTSIPTISYINAEQYVDVTGKPTGNITGLYSTLKDMEYFSYKFLQKVAPLPAGKSVVFLENPNFNSIPKEHVIDALQRLHIPLKAVVNTAIYEDWQAAILKYNDDPDVGWILMGVWPIRKRDGSFPAMATETAVWHREHLKKPIVTYWEVAVQWGLLCAFGVNLDDTGLQCGEMAARALKGEDITTIKAEYPRNTLVALNRQTADAMGIIFSPDVLNLANVIYHDWEGKNVTRKSGLQ